MEFSTFEIAQMAVDALLVVGAVWLTWHSISKLKFCISELEQYHRKVQLMTAESRETATDPALIAEWVDTRSKLTKGCPKWKAYTRRLKAEGYEE